MASLRPGLTYADAGGRLIFLDVRADRYFCLDREAEAAFRAFACDGSAPGNESADRFGLTVPSIGAPRLGACTPPPVPVAEPTGPVPHPAGMIQTLRALAALQMARLTIRLRGLAPALAAFERAKRRSRLRRASPDELAATLAGFRNAELFATTADACLDRSCAIGRHLLAQNLEASLVFGVRLGPFAAHCWVQHGDVLANDKLDVVRTFTPILVL